MLAAGGSIVQTWVQKQEVCPTVLSEVDSVHSEDLFSFLHGGRVFPITLRGIGVALRVNEIGITCKGNRLRTSISFEFASISPPNAHCSS